jgi:hypothetical protein
MLPPGAAHDGKVKKGWIIQYVGDDNMPADKKKIQVAITKLFKAQKPAIIKFRVN